MKQFLKLTLIFFTSYSLDAQISLEPYVPDVNIISDYHDPKRVEYGKGIPIVNLNYHLKGRVKSITETRENFHFKDTVKTIVQLKFDQRNELLESSSYYLGQLGHQFKFREGNRIVSQKLSASDELIWIYSCDGIVESQHKVIQNDTILMKKIEYPSESIHVELNYLNGILDNVDTFKFNSLGNLQSITFHANEDYYHLSEYSYDNQERLNKIQFIKFNCGEKEKSCQYFFYDKENRLIKINHVFGETEYVTTYKYYSTNNDGLINKIERIANERIVKTMTLEYDHKDNWTKMELIDQFLKRAINRDINYYE